MPLSYPAALEEDVSGRLLVTFRDLPEARTDGATVEEALVEAQDCLNSVLAFRAKDGIDIPRPSPAQPDEFPIEADEEFLRTFGLPDVVV
ncbi:MAG: type II toxin-antitoxin system HicB family antitoxin [Alphaproteobacteria bacterium]|jgi:antitoxin HicB|nr:type II toxin-antitoxin system HicB family antitoxin [Alphaproteobacteria bacterium]